MPDSSVFGLGVVAAMFSGAIGYFTRGQIRGTTSDKLWDVAEKIREELRGENKELELRVRDLEKANAQKDTELGLKTKQIEKLEFENVRLSETKAVQDERIKYLETRVKELEAKSRV